MLKKQPRPITADPLDLQQAGFFRELSEGLRKSDGRSSIGEAIRLLRKEKGISQEVLAKKASVNRTTIARIECGIFKSLSLDRLEEIASSVGTDLRTLLLKAESMGEAMNYRGHLSQVAFTLDYPEDGFRIASLTPKRKEFFFGKIEIDPQKTILTEKLPHPAQIYLHFLEGKALLVRDVQEFLFKQGDCFAFSGAGEYELYNPDQLKKSSALFITYPSFLSA
jgi:transcriptional regulator with XRE-family HTH domain